VRLRTLRCLAPLLVIPAAIGLVGPSTTRAAWDDLDVRTWTIHYRTHDGFRRTAYVVLPEWYGPGNNPSLPLIISPHGRGVSAVANIRRWGNLPARGAFAVVSPDGQGRRLKRFSWGYAGQIEDLARMPGTVGRALPWLAIDRSRIYAFGASMGGQEALLLHARHPSLLAGTAVFDAVADMARRYRDFGRLPCDRRCRARVKGRIGTLIRKHARAEIGGTPASHPRAYARRSPLTYAKAIARSGVPLQLWWSTADRIVPARHQSARLMIRLKRLRPGAPVAAFSGSWRHSSEMNPRRKLIPALRRFGLLAAGRPVHASLPWHDAVLDDRRQLLAWYRPKAGLGYDRVLRLGWRFLERRVPVDPKTGGRVYLGHAVFDGETLQGVYWQHHPAFLYSSLVDSLIGWYPYSGDRRAIATVRRMLDYQLAHGTTPAKWAWARVPFATSCAGERAYGRCLAGLPRRFYGGTEPDKVGLLGLGYLLFFELTGERRYLLAAVRAGDALAQHVRAGDATRTPWPFRVNARTGAVVDGARFGGMVVGPVRLLDELIEVGAGDVEAYRRARDLAWSWLLEHQLNRSSPAWHRWSGFYEDVPYNPQSRNQASPTMTAHYLLTHPSPDSIDPLWKGHARSLQRWVQVHFGRGPFLGVWGIDEQRAPGKPGCCSAVGLGSTTSRWAAVNALLYARTGDRRARRLAVRSLNYATYFVAHGGRISCCGQRRHNTYWFSDGYGDYLRSFSWAMAAMPELAPKGQNHLLGSSSVVQAVEYGRRRLTYRTFDARSVEVVRLNFRPGKIVAGDAPLPERSDLSAEGYVTRPLGGGDFVIRIRHDRSRLIQID
jgi:dienelactone hydrolase